jgi:hypothetical protein
MTSKRICVNCGKEKDIYRGKYCINDHFTCEYCGKQRHDCYACKKDIK